MTDDRRGAIQPARGTQGALDAELREWEYQFQQIKLDATALVHDLSDAQFNWRPAEGRWSIGDCLDHLNVGADVYLPIIRSSIGDARARRVLGRGPFRYGLIESWFVRTMEPPVRRRFKAPKIFLPEGRLTREEIADGFQMRQSTFIELLHEADGVDLRKARVPSPVFPAFKMSLGQGFALMAAHARRHLWQARQVRLHKDFPRTG